MLLLARVETAWARWIFLDDRHPRAAVDGSTTPRLPGRRRDPVRGLFHADRLARGSRSRRALHGRAGFAAEDGVDGRPLWRYAGAASVRMLLPVAVTGPVLLAWLSISGRGAAVRAGFPDRPADAGPPSRCWETPSPWNAARLDRLHHARRPELRLFARARRAFAERSKMPPSASATSPWMAPGPAGQSALLRDPGL